MLNDLSHPGAPIFPILFCIVWTFFLLVNLWQVCSRCENISIVLCGDIDSFILAARQNVLFQVEGLWFFLLLGSLFELQSSVNIILSKPISFSFKSVHWHWKILSIRLYLNLVKHV